LGDTRRISAVPATDCLENRGKIELAVADMGEQDLNNIARPLRTYRVVL
jgi:hypothetical protein